MTELGTSPLSKSFLFTISVTTQYDTEGQESTWSQPALVAMIPESPTTKPVKEDATSASVIKVTMDEVTDINGAEIQTYHL